MDKAGINIGAETLSGVSYPEWITDDVRMLKFKGFKHFRMAMSDYKNANAITYQKFYMDRIKALYPEATLMWGVNKTAFKNELNQWVYNKWRLSGWNDLKTAILGAAQYVQAKEDAQQALNGQSANIMFMLGNEDDSGWCRTYDLIAQAVKVGSTITVTTVLPHGIIQGERVEIQSIGPLMNTTASSEIIHTVVDEYTFKFNPYHPGTDGTFNGGKIMPIQENVRDRYIAFGNELINTHGITVPMVYSIGQGSASVLGKWNMVTPFIKALNVYGEGADVATRLANFKTQVDQFITFPQPAGALKMVTEYGCHANFTQYPNTYAGQVADLKEKKLYLDSKVDRHFFYNWRSDSHVGNQNDNFAMMRTWSGSPLYVRWGEVFI